MKRTSIWLPSIFILVAVFTSVGLIIVMIVDEQEQNTSVEREAEQDESANEYWTKERMQEAEPQSMPTVSTIDKVKALVSNTLPILIILWICLTTILIIVNRRKIKLLEQQLAEKTDDD